jgi:hypothetical protein
MYTAGLFAVIQAEVFGSGFEEYTGVYILGCVQSHVHSWVVCSEKLFKLKNLEEF